MTHPTADGLFAFGLMRCKRRVQISPVKSIGNVFELSGVAFCLAPPNGGLLVKPLCILSNRRSGSELMIGL